MGELFDMLHNREVIRKYGLDQGVAIVKPIAPGVTSIAHSGVSRHSVTKGRVAPKSKTISAKSTVTNCILWVGFWFSGPLGDMDGSRVGGNIGASASITTITTGNANSAVSSISSVA